MCLGIIPVHGHIDGMSKPLEEQLAQIEQDIEDHRAAERIEQMRFEQEGLNWSETELDDFQEARKASSDYLADLLERRAEIKTELDTSQTP